MTVYQDDWLTIHGGDNREVMRALPAGSVQMVCTSPPYWGLRDYGTASWDGGDPECDHKPARRAIGNSPSTKSTLTTNNGQGPKEGDKFSAGSQWGYAQTCPCGATRQDRQLGLETTPEAYVAAMVDVFREVRRVLRADGTLWLNLGDSYAGSPTGTMTTSGPLQGGGFRANKAFDTAKASGLKPKDLVGIPWRVAFALQADGWYLRADVIWSKPNPMPESVTDRPTKAHEYLFLLSRSERYHYDADAIREPNSPEGMAHHDRYTGNGHAGKGSPDRNDGGRYNGGVGYNSAGRNRRSVWTIATKPYPGAHFATFPEALVEPCILAGTSAAGACATCGAPWERVVERETKPPELRNAKKAHGGLGNNLGGQAHQDWQDAHPPRSVGWQRTCAHDGEPVPCVVMDPFAGTGTVGAVAQRLSRRALLIDLNPDYLTQCLERNRQTPLGLSA